MTALFPHQIDAIKFLKENPKSLCIVPMGGGKTRVIVELLKDLNLRNVFIMSLANIIKSTWSSEMEKWGYAHSYKVYNSTKELQKYNGGVAMANIDLSAPFVAKWHNKLDAVIIDESSIIKTPQTKRFKFLKHIETKRIHMLSALPAPNGFHNLWSQIFILDKGERLGKSYQKFLTAHFELKEVRAFVFSPVSPKENHETIILNKIKDLAYVSNFKRERAYKVYEKTCFFDMPLLTKQVFNQVKKSGVYNHNIYTDAGSRFGKLRQLLSGFIYASGNKEYTLHDEERLLKFTSVLNFYQNKKIIVIYNFLAERDEIVNLLKIKKVNHTLKANDFIKEDISVFVAHAKSVGMGLNLQKASVLIWYSQTLSFESFFQMKGRIDRTGQTENIHIINIYCSHNLETRIAEGLAKKEKAKTIIESYFKADNEVKSISYTNL